MDTKKIICIAGTRPEAIKMSPVIKRLKQENIFNVTVLATGQHTDMLRQAFADFWITADYDLNIMRQAQSLDYILSSVLNGVGKFLDDNGADLVLVHGDTSTTFAAALASFYRNIPVGHVEAGLRSNNIKLPFPEEANRVLTDRIADLFFAPTEIDAENLKREGISDNKIFITGNTVIDALYEILKRENNSLNYLSDYDFEKSPLILMTAHRRESWGEKLKGICAAVNDILDARPDVKFLIPLHKNPVVREVIKSELASKSANIIFTEPLNYPDFVHAMNKSFFILSDSGGVQEEASAINKPVLIMRELSERPEAITHGTCILTGTDRNKIRDTALKLLNNPAELDNILSKNTMPFGNGKSSEKICAVIKNFWEVK